MCDDQDGDPLHIACPILICHHRESSCLTRLVNEECAVRMSTGQGKEHVARFHGPRVQTHARDREGSGFTAAVDSEQGGNLTQTNGDSAWA
jgi:hypothetical protein